MNSALPQKIDVLVVGAVLVVVDAVVRVYSDINAEADEAAALVARGMEQDGHRVIVRAPALRRAEAGWAVLLGHRGSRIVLSQPTRQTTPT